MFQFRCSECKQLWNLENANGSPVYFSLQVSQKIICMNCLQQIDDKPQITVVTKYFVVVQESDY